MLILHISDTHLGKRQYSLSEREKDIYNVFSQLIDIAIKEHVDAVIHSGDLFDEYNPSNNALVYAIQGLKKLKDANIPFLSIPGDHDTPKRKGVLYPHRTLSEVDLIRILDYQKPFVLNNLEIYGIPHIPTVAKTELKKILSSLKPKTKKSILLMHQGIKEILPYESAWQIDSVGDLPDGFGYYALGHFHTRWKLEREDGSIVAIAGSPDIMREEEIDGYNKYGKGAYLIDFSKELPKLQEINLDIRPQKVVTINTKNLSADIQKLKNELKNEKVKPILHIILKGDSIKKDVLNRELALLDSVALYYRIYKDETRQVLGDVVLTLPKEKGLDNIIIEYLTKYEGFDKTEASLILELIKNVDSEDIISDLITKLTGVEMNEN
ncbi:MAG: DNA double-strand break repair protein Mre11 [Sulfolobales archaeon]